MFRISKRNRNKLQSFCRVRSLSVLVCNKMLIVLCKFAFDCHNNQLFPLYAIIKAKKTKTNISFVK